MLWLLLQIFKGKFKVFHIALLGLNKINRHFYIVTIEIKKIQKYKISFIDFSKIVVYWI